MKALKKVIPPDGNHAITASDEVFQRVLTVMADYECHSVADAVVTESAVTLNRDEAKLAQVLADQLAERVVETVRQQAHHKSILYNVDLTGVTL